MDKKLLEEFNELAKAEIALGAMWKNADVMKGMDYNVMGEYYDARTKAQYAGAQVAVDFSMMIGHTLAQDPEFKPRDEDELNDCIKGLIWGLNALNNCMNYDFERFGEAPFKEALPKEADKANIDVLAQKHGWQNLSRLVR